MPPHTLSASPSPVFERLDTYDTRNHEHRHTSLEFVDSAMITIMPLTTEELALLSDDVLFTNTPETHGDLKAGLVRARKYKDRLPAWKALASPLFYLANREFADAKVTWTRRIGRIFRTLQRQVLPRFAMDQQASGYLGRLTFSGRHGRDAGSASTRTL